MFVTDSPWRSPYSSATLTNIKELKMKLNVGGIDRALRILAGLVLIGLTLSGMIGVWGWIGIVPLATGIFGLCPAYSLLGVSTCAKK